MSRKPLPHLRAHQPAQNLPRRLPGSVECALQQPDAEEALKLEKLRLSIQAGVAALARGDYTEIDEAELDAYFDKLAARPRR
jgi:hypothetical protein